MKQLAKSLDLNSVPTTVPTNVCFINEQMFCKDTTVSNSLQSPTPGYSPKKQLHNKSPDSILGHLTTDQVIAAPSHCTK